MLALACLAASFLPHADEENLPATSASRGGRAYATIQQHQQQAIHQPMLACQPHECNIGLCSIIASFQHAVWGFLLQ
jgi:hypothetical protein